MAYGAIPPIPPGFHKGETGSKMGAFELRLQKAWAPRASSI